MIICNSVDGYLVGEGLSVEVNCVDVHLVAHSNEIPLHLLPRHHGDATRIAIHFTIDSCHWTEQDKTEHKLRL